MKAQVNTELCIGCGLCAEDCPDVFVMAEDKAQVKVEAVPANSEDCCKKAKGDCPVEAIAIEE